MFDLKKLFVLSALAVATLGVSACSPEVGSQAWCAEMKEKHKGDWSANEAASFAKSCVF